MDEWINFPCRGILSAYKHGVHFTTKSCAKVVSLAEGEDGEGDLTFLFCFQKFLTIKKFHVHLLWIHAFPMQEQKSRALILWMVVRCYVDDIHLWVVVVDSQLCEPAACGIEVVELLRVAWFALGCSEAFPLSLSYNRSDAGEVSVNQKDGFRHKIQFDLHRRISVHVV